MRRRQDGTPSTRAEIRRWVSGQRAASATEREVARAEGPHPERAIALALSMFEAARTAGVPPDPLREREVARVRATWRKLRKPSHRKWREPANPRS